LKLIQINTSVNTGSTGRIAEDIGKSAMANNFESYIAYGRVARDTQSNLIRIGNEWDVRRHVLSTRLFDNHGFASIGATREFVQKLELLKPDIIHLHNVHGYYLNVEILFDYLSRTRIPVVWTLHDCWPFTGHCSHFERLNCYKWMTQCYECPNRTGYPESWWIDNSKRNYMKKRRLFTRLTNMHIAVSSQWLVDHLKDSFLREYPVHKIFNGIDLNAFKIMDDTTIRNKYALDNYKLILGVASTWNKRKALDDFIRLSRLIGIDERIVLVGIDRKQSTGLPSNIIPVDRTESIDELAAFYSASSVFVNPTYVDNFPTTNIEALACGTPVITYNTGGSPESIDKDTGIVIEKGDLEGLYAAITHVLKLGKPNFTIPCRKRAEKLFNKEDRYLDYIHLYQDLLNQ